jgi:hypothetical protein
LGNGQICSPAQKGSKFIDRQGGGGDIRLGYLRGTACQYRNSQQQQQEPGSSFHGKSPSKNKFLIISYHICQETVDRYCIIMLR